MSPAASLRNHRITVRRATTVGVLLLSMLLAGCYPDLDWRPLAPAGGRFTVLMPARSQEASRPIVEGTTMHMWTTRAAEAVFAAGYADYPDEARRHFDGIRDAFLAKPGSKLVEERDFLLDKLPGRALAIASSPDAQRGDHSHSARVMQVRLFASGQRLYQLAVIGRSGAISKEDTEFYFDSVRIAP